MKKLFLSMVMVILASQFAVSQISSTDCLEDLKKMWVHLDHERIQAGAEQVRFAFTHQYIMRLDEEQKTVRMEESMVIGPKFVYYDTPEFTECSDATEAFNYRKHQFIIYRTKGTLSKTGAIIPLMDKGVFAYCIAKECDFIPAPGEAAMRHKRALLTVNDEGQKKYQVKELEFVWNPVTGAPIVAAASFTDRSIWKWARWDFQSIGPVETPMATDVKSNLMDANGQLLGRFKGSELLDYR